MKLRICLFAGIILALPCHATKQARLPSKNPSTQKSTDIIPKSPAMQLTPSNYPSISFKKESGKNLIPICTSLPLKGDSNIIGRQMLAGIETYLRGFRHFAHDITQQENRFIFELKKNNELIGDMGISSIKSLLATAPIMVGLVGTETFLALTPFIKRKELLMLFPIEGDPVLRKAQYENVIYYRPSHEKELRALANYAIKVKHKNNVAIFYEASIWGEDTLKALKNILKEYNISSLLTASYPQGTVDIDNALDIISNKLPHGAATYTSPNVIFCLAQPRPAYSFISNAINAGLHECIFLGLSNLNVIQKLLKTSKGLDITVTSVVPNTQTADLPIVHEYKETFKSFLSFRDDSPFYFEAFINMAIFDDCLGKIEQPVTIEKIIKTLQSYQNVNFKGLSLNFNPADRSLSSAVWINPGIGRDWIAPAGSE